MLDRLLHHGHVLRRPRSWRTKSGHGDAQWTKAKAIGMPGKERRRHRDSGSEASTRSLTIGISQQRRVSDSQPIGPTAEDLAYRFLRSQPVFPRSGSLRRARPQRSDYHHSTTSRHMTSLLTPATATVPCPNTLRQVKQSRLRPLRVAGFESDHKWPL